MSLAVAEELRDTSGSQASFHRALVFHGRNRSTSGYTLFLCHGIYIDVSQETLQLIVLFAFKGRKPAGCPSLPCARTGGQRRSRQLHQQQLLGVREQENVTVQSKAALTRGLQGTARKRGCFQVQDPSWNVLRISC